MTTAALSCIKCGTPLSYAGTGRKPRYCAQSCRRAAEYELRRVQRHLFNLEAQRTTYQRRQQVVKEARIKRRIQEDIDALTAAIDRQEARLRALLGAGEGSI